MRGKMGSQAEITATLSLLAEQFPKCFETAWASRPQGCCTRAEGGGGTALQAGGNPGASGWSGMATEEFTVVEARCPAVRECSSLGGVARRIANYDHSCHSLAVVYICN